MQQQGAVCGRCTMRTAQSAKGGNITDEHAAIRLVGLCKWMIRSYKGGGLMTKAERAAVAEAIAETEQLVDGAERLRLIDLVLWKRTHTLQGAAMAVYVSERTAQEWHRQFIRLVGQKRGLL